MTELVAILRLSVLIGWTLIVLWDSPCARRVVVGRAAGHDWLNASRAVAGTAIIMIALVVQRQDYWMAIALLLLAVAAGVVFLLSHLPATPAGHKRAAVCTYLAILVMCVGGGFIA